MVLKSGKKAVISYCLLFQILRLEDTFSCYGSELREVVKLVPKEQKKTYNYFSVVSISQNSEK